MWARFLALSSSKRGPPDDDVLLVGDVVAEHLPSDRVCGTPSTRASMMTPKVVCMAVCLKSLLSTTLGMASRFSSMTTRMPERSDSSRRSEISEIFFSRTSSAIFSMSWALFTW